MQDSLFQPCIEISLDKETLRSVQVVLPKVASFPIFFLKNHQLSTSSPLDDTNDDDHRYSFKGGASFHPE